MEKIIDIHGYNAEFDRKLLRDNSWFGRILLGEDENFEGIVEDYYSEEFYFVFGQCAKESMTLTKCSLEDREIPNVFDGLKEKGKVQGVYFKKDLENQIELGNCKINLLPAEATREETEEEKKVLKEKIARVKKRLGVVGTTLHREFETTKSESKENVKKTTKL